MELFPILERRNKLNDNLWYVLSPASNVQIQGGVGSKLCSRDSDVYITCGAQPDKSFGAVYHLSLDTFNLVKLKEEFEGRYEHAAVLHTNNTNNATNNTSNTVNNTNNTSNNTENTATNNNTATSSDCKILVFGGANTEGNRNDLQSLDLGDKKVSDVSIKEPPSPRTIHNVGVWGDNVLVWGGGDTGSVPVQDTALHSLDIGSKEWRKYESGGEIPSLRHGHVVCVVKDKLYLHGGMSGESILDDFYSADLSYLKSDCMWSKHTTQNRQPCARAAHSSAAHNHFLYIAGGFTGQQALDDLWRYDTESGVWSEITVQEPRPPPRLDLTICTARLPYSDNPDETLSEEKRAAEPAPIQDITSLLHDAVEETAPLPSHVIGENVAGYQDVLVMFGGMDLVGNIFNDIYAIKL